MKMGVDLAVRLGYQNVILEGDSETVISAFNHFPATTDWRIQAIVTETFPSLRQLQTWCFSHVKRDANFTVHQLARWAATELISGDNLCNVKHFLDLSLLYKGIDPP